MGYPDTFEGFMINSQKDWTTFKKQEVGNLYQTPCVPLNIV